MSSSLFSAESTQLPDAEDLIRESALRRLSVVYGAVAMLFPAFLAGAGISSEAEYLAAYTVNGRPFPVLAEFDADMLSLAMERFVRNQQPLVIGPRTLQ